VQHRHLLPNEIDLLVDHESGFGVQPLREHVRDCPDCRARLTVAERVVGSLAEVPLFAPRVGMADRIMSQVPVFVPWHVAARDAVVQWVSVVTGLVGEEARSAATNAAGDVVVALFGPQVISAVQQVGPLGIAFAAGGFVVASVATVLGLRLIAASSRARS